MSYVEAPENVEFFFSQRSLFLAGGITGCPEWQKEMVGLLEGTDLALFNPRRDNFPIHDPATAPKQIKWEHEYLRRADAILFWFPQETLCPIVLYELGAWSMTDKPLFVGVHPQYKRCRDVMIQTFLVRPDVKIVCSLEDLADQVMMWHVRSQGENNG